MTSPAGSVHHCQDRACSVRSVPALCMLVGILVSVRRSVCAFRLRPHRGPRSRASPPAPSPRVPAAALALPAGPAEAACALCQRAPREPVRADCGHRFCRACVVRFWAEEDGPFPCPECADDCWQRAVEPGRPPLSRRLLALEEAAAAPTRDGPASEAALQLLCRVDGGPLCAACRMAAGPEPPEWEPRWRKVLRGKVRKSGACAPLSPSRPRSLPPDGALTTVPVLRTMPCYQIPPHQKVLCPLPRPRKVSVGLPIFCPSFPLWAVLPLPPQMVSCCGVRPCA